MGHFAGLLWFTWFYEFTFKSSPKTVGPKKAYDRIKSFRSYKLWQESFAKLNNKSFFVPVNDTYFPLN